VGLAVGEEEMAEAAEPDVEKAGTGPAPDVD